MRIVDKRKFFRMVLFVIGILFFIIFTFSNKSFSKGEIKEKEIYVSNGDTLWSIASEEKNNNLYYENKDIRDIIYEIKQMNNIENNSTLVVGQKITINSL